LTSARAAWRKRKARIKEADSICAALPIEREQHLRAGRSRHAEADAAALTQGSLSKKPKLSLPSKLCHPGQQPIDDGGSPRNSGIVTTKNAQAGEMISPAVGRRPIHRERYLHDRGHESLEIEIDVTKATINRVQPSQPRRGDS